MINIAIVEDEDSYAHQLGGYLDRYANENGKKINYTFYTDGYQIIDNYKAQFDIIFMDVKMKYMDGMTAAKKIRKIDSEVVIIFITTTSQYAIKGYAVDALDYVLKPISYFDFTQRLERGISRIIRHVDKYTTIVYKGGAQKLNIKDIYYIEIENHTLTYHTKDGEYSVSGTMKSVEEELKDEGFFRCNSCYLVNLRYVEGMRDRFTIVNGEKLLVSRSRRTAFLDVLVDYMREV